MTLLLLVFALAAITPWSLIAQETDWYLSDGAAIRYKAIPERTAQESEWSLSVQKFPGLEKITHYRKGIPVNSRIQTLDSSGRLSREAVEVDGTIQEERLYSPQQQLTLERLFLPDGSVDETRYFYDGNRLVSSSLSRAGKEVNKRVYLYYPDGRLAGVREQVEDRSLPTGMERPRPGRTTSWTGTPEGLILSVYDETGRLLSSRNYRGGVLLSTEERIWREGRLASLSTEQHGDGTRVVLSYDESGRLVSRVESKGKEISAYFEFEYDQEGRMVLEVRETAGKTLSLAYVYNSDGRLQSETRTQNGLITLSRVFMDSDELVEEYYDEGRLFARVFYKGGRKSKETIFSQGKPVRERSF